MKDRADDKIQLRHLKRKLAEAQLSENTSDLREKNRYLNLQLEKCNEKLEHANRKCKTLANKLETDKCKVDYSAPVRNKVGSQLKTNLISLKRKQHLNPFQNVQSTKKVNQAINTSSKRGTSSDIGALPTQRVGVTVVGSMWKEEGKKQKVIQWSRKTSSNKSIQKFFPSTK